MKAPKYKVGDIMVRTQRGNCHIYRLDSMLRYNGVWYYLPAQFNAAEHYHEEDVQENIIMSFNKCPQCGKYMYGGFCNGCEEKKERAFVEESLRILGRRKFSEKEIEEGEVDDYL